MDIGNDEREREREREIDREREKGRQTTTEKKCGEKLTRENHITATYVEEKKGEDVTLLVRGRIFVE